MVAGTGPGAYETEGVRVLRFDEAVRARPGMYFGVGLGDPRLATKVFEAVVGHAFHPAASVARAHLPMVTAEITGDLAFSVVDDQVTAWDRQGVARRGYFDSLMTSDRWQAAAAAAVSARTVVEVWRDGAGLRQELDHLRPTAGPQPFDPPPGRGTGMRFELDPEFFGTAAITAAVEALTLHGPDCTRGSGPGRISISDRRRAGW